MRAAASGRRSASPHVMAPRRRPAGTAQLLNGRTYIHTYTHTYINSYIHSDIHTYIHTYTPTYLHTYIHTHIHTYIHEAIPTYIHTYIQTYIQCLVNNWTSAICIFLWMHCRKGDVWLNIVLFVYSVVVCVCRSAVDQAHVITICVHIYFYAYTGIYTYMCGKANCVAFNVVCKLFRA